MNFTEEEVKKIILDEMQKSIEEAEMVRKLKNVGSLSFEAFMNVISALSQDLKMQPEEAIQAYLELALDLKKNWLPKQWDNFTEQEKELFLKTTYPKISRDESEDILISSFTNPVVKKVIYSDILLAVEKAEDAKKEIKAGEYLGPEKVGADPKSPYWKEYLEEVIKEEIINHLK